MPNTTEHSDNGSRVERWLLPVSEVSPAGEDQRYDPTHEAMRNTIAGLDRPDGPPIDWDVLSTQAEQLLVGGSKDLLVACYLAHALLQTEGIAGLTHGVALLSGMLDKYWESCFPAMKRIRGRVSAFEWFVERTSAVLLSKEGADIEALSRELVRLSPLVAARFGEHAPAIKPMLDAVERIRLSSPTNVAATSEGQPEAVSETAQGDQAAVGQTAAMEATTDATLDSIQGEVQAAPPQPVVDSKQAKLTALKRTFSQPISDTTPAGQDPRYDEMRDAMRAETQKLSRAAGVDVDWESIRQNGQIFLTQRSKDLGVASYFAAAAYELGGIQGLTEGLCAINAFLENYWDNGYPAKKRMRARINAITWLVDRVESLAEIVPTVDQQEQIDTLELAVKELTARVSERFVDEAPPVRPLSAHIERMRLSLTASQAAVQQPQPTQAPTESSSQISQQATPSQSQGQPVPVQLEAPQAELADPEQVREFLRAVGTSLHKASRELFKVSVANPLAYRLCRLGLYMPFDQAPPASNGNQTSVPPPPSDRIQQLNTLLNAQNWGTLLDEAESGLGPSRMWLDLHRFVAIALEGLGHTEARAAVIAELGALVQRIPELLDRTFSDGQPFADDTTRQWLAAEVSSSATGPAARGSSAASGGAMEQELRQAHQLATGGKLEDALAKLTSVIESESIVGRDRFRAKLAMAQACSAAGSHALADGIFAGLNREIEQFRVEQWEPSLAEACYHGRYKALKAMAGEDSKSKGELADVYRQLCRVAPATALKLGKPNG